MRHRRPVRTIGFLLLVGMLASVLSIACENRPPTPTPTATPQPTAAMPSPTPTLIPTPTPTHEVTLALLTTAATDRTALVALYHATGGPNWANNSNWLSDRPLDEWHGVTTDGNGRVIELSLNENQLRGSIPAELGILAKLDILSLYDNELSGQIPAQLGNLPKLRMLDLKESQLSGQIPPELGNLANLRELNLSINRLSGPIPPELGRLSRLISLDISGNELSGPVPAELVGLSYLERLDLYFTELCAPADDEFQTWLRRINHAFVVNCERPDGSTIDADRAALVALYHAAGGLNWTNNSNWLSDRPLGEWHGVNTDSDGRVTGLNLHNNRLSGQIPAKLGSLSNLQELRLEDNKLAMWIPAELGDLANLWELDLNGNSALFGSLPGSLTGLTSLTTLRLDGTGLCAPTEGAFQTWLQGCKEQGWHCLLRRAGSQLSFRMRSVVPA